MAQTYGMQLDFTRNTEYNGTYFDFECPFEYPDGRVYRPQSFMARPLPRCVRCEAEIASQEDGEILLFVVRFWEDSPKRYLMETQQRLYAIRVRQLIYAYLNENRHPQPISRAGEAIEFDWFATPQPLYIP